VCKQYCFSNSDCAAGTTCQFAWSPPEYAGTSAVGYCQ
jgi:Cys-rich repeat protein